MVAIAGFAAAGFAIAGFAIAECGVAAAVVVFGRTTVLAVAV
jgi:hypothetical protein